MMMHSAGRTALVVLGISCGTMACGPAPDISPVLPSQATARTVRYEGSVSIHPDSGSLSAAWRILLEPRESTLDSVVFFLNRQLSVEKVSGPAVTSYQDTLLSDRRRITVRYRRPQDRVSIDIAYAGIPRLPGDSINSLNTGWVELALDSYWLPVIADHAHSIVGSARIAIPGGWSLATSGRTRRDGAIYTLVQNVPLIDIPFSAAPTMRATTRGNTTVHNVRAVDSVVARVSSTADACATHLDAKYGAAMPLPPLHIVLAPRSGPGYARKNYIVITPSANMSQRSLTRFLCHEVAHYWAVGAIPSGPDNWINEGFAEFVSGRAVRELVSRAAYDTMSTAWRRNGENQPPIWTGPTGSRPSAQVSYSKAPWLLHRLEERVGPEVMDRLLRRFLTEPIRTTPAVVELIRAVAGAEQADWFAAELGK